MTKEEIAVCNRFGWALGPLIYKNIKDQRGNDKWLFMFSIQDLVDPLKKKSRMLYRKFTWYNSDQGHLFWEQIADRYMKLGQ